MFESCRDRHLFSRIIPGRARLRRRRPGRSDSVKRLSAWCGFLLIAATAVSAQPAGEAETAIRHALSRWTNDFNTGDAARICDLFAKDLLYDYRGFPERDYESLCTLLRRSLADQTKKFTYSLDIKEIIVAGDLAVVRLVWTLKVTVPGTENAVETKEPGLDVFRRQPDGSWKIVRYIAYEEP
jgi:uncharacterized protein (TIGR02246 family)